MDTDSQGRSNGRSGVAILFDVENLLFTAMKHDEEARKMPIREILHATTFILEGHARRYGWVEKRIAAISIPPMTRMKDSVKHQLQRRKDTLRIVEFLSDIGYDIFMVRQGKDAADKGLRFMAGGIRRNYKGIKNLMLATGDAGSDFAEIIDMFINVRGLVEVVAYDCSPKFKFRHGVRFSQISHGIRIMAEEAGQNGKTLGRVDIPLPSQVDFLRRSIHKFAKNPRDGTVSGQHYRWISEAIWTWRGAFGARGANSVNFAEICEAIEKKFLPANRNKGPDESAEHNDKIPTHEEVEALAKYLVDFTDIFERKQILSFNPRSRFLSAV